MLIGRSGFIGRLPLLALRYIFLNMILGRGTYLAAKVQQAIGMSDALLVLLTPNSQGAPYVQQEIGFAQGLMKLVIPLVWPDVEARSLAMLQGREYVAFDPSQAASALPPILEYLGKLKTQKELGQTILAVAALVLAAVGLSKS
jgi:hypothetical protein